MGGVLLRHGFGKNISSPDTPLVSQNRYKKAPRPTSTCLALCVNALKHTHCHWHCAPTSSPPFSRSCRRWIMAKFATFIPGYNPLIIPLETAHIVRGMTKTFVHEGFPYYTTFSINCAARLVSSQGHDSKRSSEYPLKLCGFSGYSWSVLPPFTLSFNMENVPISYVLASVPVVYMLWNWLGPNGLHQVPTIGTSIPILAYLNGLRFIKHAKTMMQEGYDKYASKGGMFKIAMPDQWLVLIAGPTLIEEVRKMPDDMISLAAGIEELLAARYILGKNVVNDPFHMPLIHAKLTRNLTDFYGDIKEEMWDAFETCLGVHDQWHSVPALKTVIEIISRTTNRVFVGLPLCRDPEFLAIATSFTLEVVKAKTVVNLFPEFMKGPIAKLVNKVPATIKNLHAHIGPTIRERRQRSQEASASGSGESWDEKPNDMLMWLIDEGIRHGYSDEIITEYLLVVEFTALHTTATSFTHALYYLAADPSLAVPMRQEVESVLAAEGGDWGKGAVNQFYKIDSLLRESQRLNGINSTTLWRKTLGPVTFSNGITLPKGTFFSAATSPTHIDEANYENPTMFDPWRFVKTSNGGARQSYVSTNVDYMPWGHGRHACPGRHFASYQMKLMMAKIVTTYDVSFEPGMEGQRPENILFGNSIVPNRTARVMFRKRRV
ncbi:cytochrome P450 [Cristinia sonorae]|uniref:Cytochrome P450 n=1 Tax=Cristinia sonorae TaxID=1940300 RepID=A0A8K0UI71_9AGAR|nr:cytochrome P450 [Cristinia sonorae]